MSETIKRLTSWRTWLHGLVATIIYGCASAGLSSLGTATARGLGIDVPSFTWRQLGIVLLTAGIVSAFTYLKKSPLPNTEDGDIAITDKP